MTTRTLFVCTDIFSCTLVTKFFLATFTGHVVATLSFFNVYWAVLSRALLHLSFFYQVIKISFSLFLLLRVFSTFVTEFKWDFTVPTNVKLANHALEFILVD